MKAKVKQKVEKVKVGPLPMIDASWSSENLCGKECRDIQCGTSQKNRQYHWQTGREQKEARCSSNWEHWPVDCEIHPGTVEVLKITKYFTCICTVNQYNSSLFLGVITN